MASHNLNDMSSRSHAMLSIQIEQDLQGFDDPKEQMTRQGKLVFVDLAGKIFVLEISIKKKSFLFFKAVKKSKLVFQKVNNWSKQITSIKVYLHLVNRYFFSFH
jgi:hypothetical protein